MPRSFTCFVALLISACIVLPSDSYGDDVVVVIAGTTVRNFNGVYVVADDDAEVRFVELESGNLRLQKFSRASDKITVKRSTGAERSQLVINWVETLPFAVVDPGVGSKIRMLSPSVQYPLPKNATWIGGRPEVIEGTQLYCGHGMANAERIPFQDISAVSIRDKFTGEVRFLDDRKATVSFVAKCRYSNLDSEDPILSGFEPFSFNPIQVSLFGIKGFEIQTQTKRTCLGEDTKHSFVGIPDEWAFCPKCGKPLPPRSTSQKKL